MCFADIAFTSSLLHCCVCNNTNNSCKIFFFFRYFLLLTWSNPACRSVLKWSPFPLSNLTKKIWKRSWNIFITQNKEIFHAFFMLYGLCMNKHSIYLFCESRLESVRTQRGVTAKWCCHKNFQKRKSRGTCFGIWRGSAVQKVLSTAIPDTGNLKINSLFYIWSLWAPKQK